MQKRTITPEQARRLDKLLREHARWPFKKPPKRWDAASVDRLLAAICADGKRAVEAEAFSHKMRGLTVRVVASDFPDRSALMHRTMVKAEQRGESPTPDLFVKTKLNPALNTVARAIGVVRWLAEDGPKDDAEVLRQTECGLLLMQARLRGAQPDKFAGPSGRPGFKAERALMLDLARVLHTLGDSAPTSADRIESLFVNNGLVRRRGNCKTDQPTPPKARRDILPQIRKLWSISKK